MSGNMSALRRIIFKLKSGTEHLNYGREIISDWAAEHCRLVADVPRLLDLGVGFGVDLLNVRGKLDREVALFGIESYEPVAAQAAKKGIEIASLNLEYDRLPYADEWFDVVIANQILEHTKEIFFIFSEVCRVLKKGGIFVIGVPNLASLHNRIALLFGLQPPSIELLGPHVRGFTRPAFCRFAEKNGYFEVVAFAGSNFYPFPPVLSKPLAETFPTLAVGSFFLLKRTEKRGDYLEVLTQNFYQTPFFTGPSDADLIVPPHHSATTD